MLSYHHCTDLEKIIYGEIQANPEYSDPHYIDAYRWLEKQVGFYPLFLAVGETEEDIQMTGYQNQWCKVIGTEIIGRDKKGYCIHRNILRKKGEFPNYVLFSFEEVNGIFTDYENWYLVLNSDYNNYQLSNYETLLVLKPSWPKSIWLRKARKNPYSVQLVTPSLNLPDAKRIWVRNKSTKGLLESMGFENVEVKRILLNNK